MSGFSLLRIIIRRGERHGHHSLALELVAQAKAAGLAGATMVEVVSGFGAEHRTRAAGRWALSDAVAYEILIVDAEDKVNLFIDAVRSEIADRGIVVMQAVELVSGSLGQGDRPEAGLS
jgi:PII-like signaling protein